MKSRLQNSRSNHESCSRTSKSKPSLQIIYEEIPTEDAQENIDRAFDILFEAILNPDGKGPSLPTVIVKDDDAVLELDPSSTL